MYFPEMLPLSRREEREVRHEHRALAQPHGHELAVEFAEFALLDERSEQAVHEVQQVGVAETYG